MELAPGKNRIAKVKNWLHESLHGVPADHIPSTASGNQTNRDKLRKYRVRFGRLEAMKARLISVAENSTAHWAFGNWQDDNC